MTSVLVVEDDSFVRATVTTALKFHGFDVVEGVGHENEIALVPGKVLGDGTATGIKVAAVNFSAQARQKIEAAGGTCYTIPELVQQHTDGRNIRIIGG